MRPGGRVHLGDETLDWAALAQEGAGLARSQCRGRILWAVASPREALALAALGLAEGHDFGVIMADRLTPGLKATLALAGRHCLRPGDRVPLPLASATPGRIAMFSSGTTGQPKVVTHHASAVLGGRAPRTPRAWFAPWQPGSHAWWQLVLRSWHDESQHLVFPPGSDPLAGLDRALLQGRVDALSLTPSFWRLARLHLGDARLGAARLHEIVLGGEIVDQPVLDAVRALHPASRLRHVYASSEAGVVLVVDDGLAGFAAALLDQSRGARLRIRSGQLEIRAAAMDRGARGGWMASGDLVERRGARVHFLGRAGQAVINVGGAKAHAAEIEAHLLRHPEVLWARVRGQRAPLLGTLVAADLVLRQRRPPAEYEPMLTAHCAACLPEQAVPRLWQVHARVPLGPSLKS